MDTVKYEASQETAAHRFEEACRRCGECCGAADGDPCANLAADAVGAWYCRDYENRLGPQKTVSGKFFTCVPIRELMKQDALRLNCNYRTKPFREPGSRKPMKPRTWFSEGFC